MQHFNIGKKIEINPFENVKWVKIANGACCGQVKSLEKFLHSKSRNVETRKTGDTFYILLDVELLNFTTLLKWLAPFRGIFWFNNSSIQFVIEEDIMSVW